MKLYGVNEAPKYLTTNPYIKNGFRQCKSLSDSMLSIMHFHKDSIDTYTSILSFCTGIILFLVGVYLFDTLKDYKTRIIFSLFFLHILIHSPPSILTHWIGCSGYSEQLHSVLLKLDCQCIFIASLVLTVVFSLCIFSNNVAVIYSISCAVICIYLCFNINKIFYNHYYRLYSTMGMVFFYMFPLFYYCVTKYSSFASDIFVSIFLCLLLAGIIYNFHFPECYFPKIFNYFGSHSIMHILINIAQILEFIFLLYITKLL